MRVRVKTRTPYTEREFVIDADSRDEAWLHVRDHLADLTPERERQHAVEEVFWASEERPPVVR